MSAARIRSTAPGQCRTTGDNDPFQVLALIVGKEVLDGAAHFLDHGVQAAAPDAAETRRASSAPWTAWRAPGHPGSVGLAVRVTVRKKRGVVPWRTPTTTNWAPKANHCFQPPVRAGGESP